MDYTQHLYTLFADLLEYPTPALNQHAQECAKLLSQGCPPAGESLSGFQHWLGHESLSRIEEVYTSTFDLQGVCCPYVGHHLFGDTYQRSWFMARLNQGYHAEGFSSGSELPDHIAMILHFLGQAVEDEFSQVLLQEGLVPALGKMIQAFDGDSQHPYGQLLRSLNTLLQDEGSHAAGNPVRVKEGGAVDD